VINNKKVFLIYIISFFLFLTLILFPNYNSKTKLFTFFVKEKIETPFIFAGKEVRDLLMVLNLNFDYMNTIKKLEGDNNYLRSINKYLLTLTSKYSEQNKIFHQSSIKLPISVGESSPINAARETGLDEADKTVFIFALGNPEAFEISSMVGSLLYS